MRWVLLSKVSFWLIIIGAFALVTPNPAWPEWLSRMVLATGVALGLTTIGVRLSDAKREKDRRRGGAAPDTQ